MKRGVLFMAHGSPDSLDELAPFLSRIIGRPAPAELVTRTRDRYEAIGGTSPLTEITERQARALGKALDLPVYTGMRYVKPFIRDAVDQARRDGIEQLVGIVANPLDAPASVGRYQEAVQRTGFPCVLVRNWHSEPSLLEYWKERTKGKEFVLFTAHSIPILTAEPYPTQLAEMISLIASGPHALAYQSGGAPQSPWLGPDVTEVLRGLKGDVAVAPIGFVSEHVEILYDLDILHRREAEERGLRWERLPMPNDHPLLIEALASALRKRL